ncbi:MAG: carboxymuconolactone decarboxylase family protein [Kouleothrix sp.]|nr:carboxymuconolactone decarboxylase family protein [Kouleothrix sp.]
MRSTPPPFRRRYYRSALQLWRDLRQLAALRAQPHAAVTPALRERLMLVVTAVNQCRYCAAFHTRAAPLSGLASDEVALLLTGELQHAPAAELPALCYAHGWAAAADAPHPSSYAELVAIYGPDRAAGIALVLHMIRIGNLLGNTADYLLFRLSSGRLGLHAGARPRSGAADD